MANIKIELTRNNGTTKSYMWPDKFIFQLNENELKEYAIHDVMELVKELKGDNNERA